MDACNIAVIGATGAVGRVFLRILEERRFPTDSVRLCASQRSIGKKLTVRGHELTVEEATSQLLSEVDIAFISATSEVSRQIAPMAAERGALVIDDSSAFRMEPDVPLVVPEVNGDDLEKHRGLISIPNCSTTPLVMALKPLHSVNPVKRVIADTYQSVSGTGGAAMEELRTQSRQVLKGQMVDANAYPHQIAFNALPHIEPFTDNGYTKEEVKLRDETRKILHAPEIAISATCTRVPVMVGHSLAVHVEFTHPISVGEVRQLLSGFPGVGLLDDPNANVYPMPIQAADRNEVFVGRVRQDMSHPNGIVMWLVTDNLRKGAALNALQIAEYIMSRKLLLAHGRRV